MTQIKFLFFLLIIFCTPLTISAESPEQMIARFEQNKRYQVVEDNNMYYIQATSNFHDVQAKKSLVLLSKAALFKYIQDKDKKATGLDLQGFMIQHYYEKDGLLYALASVNKKQVTVSYNQAKNRNFDALIREEIQRFEAVDPKTKQIHEQLKELYFILGDIDNYNKQSDILMEILFNEN